MTYDETENSEHRPDNDVRGGIFGINQSGLLSAWAINTALPHKNLRVQVLVRDRWGRLINKSRTGRTFIMDTAVSDQLKIDGPGIGLHGFSYQIPHPVINRSKGQYLDIEVLVYADGSQRVIGSLDELRYDTGSKLPRPPDPPFSSVLSSSEKRLMTGKKR